MNADTIRLDCAMSKPNIEFKPVTYKRFLPTLKSLLAEANQPFIHRDLSWLQFNDRVLAESRQQGNPLLERAKFLSITSTNLDEFFMIRYPSIGRTIAQLQKQNNLQSMRRQIKIRSAIVEAVTKFGAKQLEALDLLNETLSSFGINVVTNYNSTHPSFQFGEEVFSKNVISSLGFPETFTVSQLQSLENFQMGVFFKNGKWLRVPKGIPNSFIYRSKDTAENYIFFLDDLLIHHLSKSLNFDGVAGVIRITRDGDFTPDIEEEDTESVPDIIRSSVSTRDKGKPMRLQFNGEFKDGQLDLLMRSMKIKQTEMIDSPTSVCLGALWSAVNQLPEDIKNKKDLNYPPIQPMIPLDFKEIKGIFEKLKKRDYLFHHPYDSFDSYVLWMKAACKDPNVIQIEQTIYRMDTLSPVLELLKKAASTKKIKVIIELRARFDELNNLRLADELRKAGVEVHFGFGQLKLHAKIALVTRMEEGNEVLYTHLSTGNYNVATARMYTDLAIITGNPDFGIDARHFFDSVYKGKIPTSFKKLASAPLRLHKIMENLIDSEIESAKQGKSARIVVKANALVDHAIIEKLYQASNAGVKIDLIIRGACALVPGVKNLSQNIRVISIVDRFLEHSRIYYFQGSKTLFLSSADWMPRNFFKRLEIAFPILDPRIYKYIEEIIIPTYLNDTIKARELTPQGTWKKRAALPRQAKIRSQFRFEELANKQYINTPLGEE